MSGKRLRRPALAVLVLTLTAASLVLLVEARTAAAAPPICIAESNWSVCYEVTATDGLLVTDGKYMGTAVFDSASVPQIDVHYSEFTLLDELGELLVPPVGAVEKVALPDGFELSQVFRMHGWPRCGTYRYVQVWRFYADGRFEPRMISEGPGMEGPHTYTTYWRIDLDIDDSAGDGFERWTAGWVRPALEGAFPFAAPTSPDGLEWRAFDGGRAYGVRADPADGAELWVLLHSFMEGEMDLPAQRLDRFPEQWVSGEEIQGTDNVLFFSANSFKSSDCDETVRLEAGPSLVASGYEAAPSATVPGPPTATPPAAPTITPEAGPTEAPGDLRGRIAFQGRTSHEGAEIFLDGTPRATSDPAGDYVIPGVSSGEHMLEARAPGYLCNRLSVRAESEGATYVRGLYITGGDPVANDRVDLFDLVVVAASYDRDPPLDPRADINADGVINIFDLVMVAGNYGRECPLDLPEMAPPTR